MLCEKHHIYTRIDPITGEEICPMCRVEAAERMNAAIENTKKLGDQVEIRVYKPGQWAEMLSGLNDQEKEAYRKGWKAAVEYIEEHDAFFRGEKMAEHKKVMVRRNDAWEPLAEVLNTTKQ